MKVERPRERFENAEVLNARVSNRRDDRLRTFITRPRPSAGRVPAISFVRWLSCDSVEYPKGETAVFGALIRRLIEGSCYATVRMDKPGVGEGQGAPCEMSDFQGELEGCQAAFDLIKRYLFIDPDNVSVIGISDGGGVAPLVAPQNPDEFPRSPATARAARLVVRSSATLARHGRRWEGY